MSRNAMQKAFEIIGVLKPDNFVHRELQGEAWDALRQALAQSEPQVCCGDYDKCIKACTPRGRWLTEKELAKPKQEPVSHLWECIGRWSAYLATNGKQGNLAPPEWLVDAVKAATSPPRKEWVGLTDKEILDLWVANHKNTGATDAFACAVEAKLKEKNT